MPELPEVETIVKALRHPADWPFQPEGGLAAQPGVIGRRIAGAAVLWNRTIAVPGVDDFAAQVRGLTVSGVKRRGKFILVNLAPKTLLIHLRMSGDLRVEEMGQPVQTHDRLLLNFEDGARLVFSDTRKFGRVWLVDDPDTVVCRLGPDPFDEDLTPQSFHASLHKRHRRIKPLLLDQNFIAGIGNIYSDEALFRAKIHPLSFSDELAPSQTGQLLQAIRDVLLEGIERNGASIDWVYRGGSFQNHFKVYQRTGLACEVCGTPIERIVLGQRSTHFCPKCQPFTDLA